jgi:hypothetical protein
MLNVCRLLNDAMETEPLNERGKNVAISSKAGQPNHLNSKGYKPVLIPFDD